MVWGVRDVFWEEDRVLASFLLVMEVGEGQHARHSTLCWLFRHNLYRGPHHNMDCTDGETEALGVCVVAQLLSDRTMICK